VLLRRRRSAADLHDRQSDRVPTGAAASFMTTTMQSESTSKSSSLH
jgi:hypothetical protein